MSGGARDDERDGAGPAHVPLSFPFVFSFSVSFYVDRLGDELYFSQLSKQASNTDDHSLRAVYCDMVFPTEVQQ